jgi:hypothetical protein
LTRLHTRSESKILLAPEWLASLLSSHSSHGYTELDTREVTQRDKARKDHDPEEEGYRGGGWRSKPPARSLLGKQIYDMTYQNRDSKLIRISPELHHELKVLASLNKQTMKALLDQSLRGLVVKKLAEDETGRMFEEGFGEVNKCGRR